MFDNFWRDFFLLVIGFIAFCMVIVASVSIALNISKSKDYQVVSMAEDLGCTYIEQSTRNPDNFYIDCGDDEIRIIKVEK